MQQFVAGFVIALLIVVPVVVLLVRKKVSKLRRNRNGHLKQLEELGKLTGELAHEIKNPLSIIKINLQLTAEELERSNIAYSSSIEQIGKEKPGAKRYMLNAIGRALRKIAVIQKETDRLEQILDGFLRYIDRTELQLASVDINELIRLGVMGSPAIVVNGEVVNVGMPGNEEKLLEILNKSK